VHIRRISRLRAALGMTAVLVTFLITSGLTAYAGGLPIDYGHQHASVAVSGAVREPSGHGTKCEDTSAV
jgi:hypothetical protein